MWVSPRFGSPCPRLLPRAGRLIYRIFEAYRVIASFSSAAPALSSRRSRMVLHQATPSDPDKALPIAEGLERLDWAFARAMDWPGFQSARAACSRPTCLEWNL